VRSPGGRRRLHGLIGSDLTNRDAKATRPTASAIPTPLSEFADRDHFALDAEALAAWETINARPVRGLDGLRRPMERPSPFGE
jgi:hypothetical protein